MTLVVSDASPLNYLILVGAQNVLPGLFGSILVPAQVILELQRPKAPEQVRTWANNLPAWVEIEEGDASRFPTLNFGEAAALSLAVDKHALLLVDEIDARAMANSLGIPVIGTIGILAEAHLRSLLDFDAAAGALSTTTFRVHPTVIAAARARILAHQPEYGRRSDEERQ